MIRKIIKIDEERCNGCGSCVIACHEGAIEIINGKAKLTREDYCDGLGDCLPTCPVNAIAFEEREAPAYDEEAVLIGKKLKESAILPCGCPGTHAKEIRREKVIAQFRTIMLIHSFHSGRYRLSYCLQGHRILKGQIC